jgi:lipopolysaccharide export system permease protein
MVWTVKILHRYLIKQNLLLLGICLLSCTGIYLLVDVFERLDNFLDHQASMLMVGKYFLLKLPLIVAQILPLVFMLAIVIQLGIMRRNRELTALEASGVHYGRIVLFFVIYAVLWSAVEFGFAQGLGVLAERKSSVIWESRGVPVEEQETTVEDVWLRAGERMVHIETLHPKAGRGSGVRIYELDPEFDRIERMLFSQKLRIDDENWVLKQVRVLSPERFLRERRARVRLPMSRDLSTFFALKERLSPDEMSIWELGRMVARLQQTGANVEGLLTAWHQKMAYALSIVVVTCIALVVTRRWSNLFFNICFGLGLAFLFYGLYVLGGLLGEQGRLAPWLAGWLGNLVIGVPAILWLGWGLRPAST